MDAVRGLSGFWDGEAHPALRDRFRGHQFLGQGQKCQPFGSEENTAGHTTECIPIPTSSPVFYTYVAWASKPRKWSKRWLELREQGLWLSKKDNGKDEIFLCSLANFDAYTVTRPHKPPKPYVFAVKSTDNLSFFENKADYVHLFCCSEKDGRTWLESILLARSYFINQDRNTLSVAGNQASGVSSKTLSRSGTRKGSRNVQQPLVQVSATTPLTAQAYKFEPGSLLAKR